MVRISEIVAEPHLENFNSMLPNQLDHGGRAGYKSSKNAIKIAILTLANPNIEAIVFRQDYTDHRDSTFRDLIWAYEKLGIKLKPGVNYPTGLTSVLFIKLPQGNFIHFKQMKVKDKLKGYRPTKPSNVINIAWFFEITEFKDRTYITTAKSSVMREAGEWFISLYEWNNAPKLSHWTYEFMGEMAIREDAYVKKTNYNDTPKQQMEEFLGKPLLKEIEILRNVNPELYKSEYLGYPANLEGTFFKTFSRLVHAKPSTHVYSKIVVGVDFGGNDATTAIARGVVRNYERMEIFKQYYHKNGVSPKIKTINDYRDDILKFCQDLFLKYKKIIILYIDSANNTTLGMLLKEQIAINYRFIDMKPLHKMKRRKQTKKEKSVIQERGDITEIIFGSNYCTIDPVECKHLIKALEGAEYNKKGELADDGRSDIDSVDGFWYSWLEDMDIIYDTIVKGDLIR